MKINKLELIKSLPYLSKDSLRLLEPKTEALNFNLKYWQKKKIIIPLKRGVYLLTDRWERETDKDGFREYLANKLLSPSYLSGEYVLQKYGLLTEATYPITSITTKSGRVFNSPIGDFIYFSLSPQLFTGFEFKKFETNEILIATKAKAVFDYFYLRLLKMTAINEKILEEFRFNWENFSLKDFREFDKYVKLFGNKKFYHFSLCLKKILPKS